jgi:predicted ATPase/DNA-binding CsgD family transcriptional regulator
MSVTVKDMPMSVSEKTCPHNLPVQLSSFVGREAEMAEIRNLLDSTRLLTLTGPGGSGKTRLALRVGEEMARQGTFEHGVWWVELATLSDPLLVPKAVALALNVAEQPGHALIDTLVETLRSQHTLLILDNCEHLVAACAGLTEALLHTCPHLHLLTTSREALNIGGETIWLVPPLRVPDTYYLPPIEGLLRYEAIQLFVDRVRAVLPSFALTQENARTVVQICRRLEGIPLATELAAARVKVLALEQIADRLDDAYHLLTSGRRTVLPHQQTLRTTMDWSYDLLSAPERDLFRRLSIFSGSFTLEMAEAICAGEGIEEGEVLDLLSRLVDKSLVVVGEGRHETNYRLLGTIRQYGQEKLREAGEEMCLRRHMRDWYVALAERAEPELLSTQQPVWLDRLEAEHDNVRAVLSWAIEQGEYEIAARIGGALWRFWMMRGYLSEGFRWLVRALDGYTERSPVRAKALHGANVIAGFQNDYGSAEKLVQESLEIWQSLGDRRGTAYALMSLGVLADQQRDYSRSASCYEQSLELQREEGNLYGVALALSSLSVVVLYQGDAMRAAKLSQESVALFRKQGDSRGIASALTNLALALVQQGAYERASACCEESLALRQKLGDKGGSAHTLVVLGRLALGQGDYVQAALHFRRSLALRQETGEQEGIVAAVEGLAEVAGCVGQLERAARLYGAAGQIRDALGSPLSPIEHAYHERAIAALRSQLGDPSFARLLAEGQALTLEQALQEAEQIQTEMLEPAQLPNQSISSVKAISQPLPSDPLPTSASRGNSFGLTAREIEVLRLVTLGLTYAQLAEKLVISPRTADAHLRSIYSKLGVTSRSAATRLALEHHLI